jgi:hypothetical protein
MTSAAATPRLRNDRHRHHVGGFHARPATQAILHDPSLDR